MKTTIETIVIRPTGAMPREVFMHLYHLAYFMEHMERLPDGRRLWDDEVTDICSDVAAEAEYEALQRGWFSMAMELPKVVVDRLACDGQLGLFEQEQRA